MTQTFRIETLDRSGRWYLTPGSRSVYDLRIRNDSKGSADCSLVVEDPVSGVDVEPAAFSLGGHDVRTVTVTFAADAKASRSQRVLLSLHSDSDGSLLATFEQPLIVTGGTDCSLAMAWKGPIIESGQVLGFEMACTVRSQSEARSSFRVALTAHPAFSSPAQPELTLDPGQSGESVIPVRWNREVKDAEGRNHPGIFEISVAVSNGRRTSRMRWELIEAKLDPYLKRSREAANGKAARATDAGARSRSERTVAPPPAAMYLLNGCVEQLMLAAPIEARPVMLPGPAVFAGSAQRAGASTPPAPPAATSSNHAGAIELPLFTQPAASAPPSAAPHKLTPYTPAHWNGSGETVKAPAAAAVPAAARAVEPTAFAATLADAATPTQAAPAHVLRQRQIDQLRRSHPVPAALLIGGLALVALVVAVVFGFRSGSQQPPATTPVTVAAPVVAVAAHGRPAHSALSASAHARALHAKNPRPGAQRPTASPTAAAATSAAATPSPATPHPAPHAVAVAAAPRHAFSHIKLYQPESGPVVALGEIEAYYGPRGRAVRVYWGAAEQASASVQLIDDHGAVVSATSVRGARQSALLFLPRRFRGALTVQVSSVGRMGERVANTTSLPPFGG